MNQKVSTIVGYLGASVVLPVSTSTQSGSVLLGFR